MPVTPPPPFTRGYWEEDKKIESALADCKLLRKFDDLVAEHAMVFDGEHWSRDDSQFMPIGNHFLFNRKKNEEIFGSFDSLLGNILQALKTFPSPKGDFPVATFLERVESFEKAMSDVHNEIQRKRHELKKWIRENTYLRLDHDYSNFSKFSKVFQRVAKNAEKFITHKSEATFNVLETETKEAIRLYNTGWYLDGRNYLRIDKYFDQTFFIWCDTSKARLAQALKFLDTFFGSRGCRDRVIKCKIMTPGKLKTKNTQNIIDAIFKHDESELKNIVTCGNNIQLDADVYKVKLDQFDRCLSQDN